jgi:hypothetical protein
MPKNSLVLNGFGGGINLDHDSSDLISKGDSNEDEVRKADNIFLDYRGKIVASYPTSIANSSGSTNITTDTSIRDNTGNSALVYNGKLYQNTGLYKAGETVTYSGNGDNIIVPPTRGGLTDKFSEPSVTLKHGVEIQWLVNRPDLQAGGKYANLFVGIDSKTSGHITGEVMGTTGNLVNVGHMIRFAGDYNTTSEDVWASGGLDLGKFNGMNSINNVHGLVHNFYQNHSSNMPQDDVHTQVMVYKASAAVGSGVLDTWASQTGTTINIDSDYLDLSGAADSSVSGGETGTSTTVSMATANEIRFFSYGSAFQKVLQQGFAWDHNTSDNASSFTAGSSHDNSAWLAFSINGANITDNGGSLVNFYGPYSETGTSFDISGKEIEIDFRLDQPDKIEGLWIAAETSANGSGVGSSHNPTDSGIDTDTLVKTWFIPRATWYSNKDSNGYAYLRIPESAYTRKGSSYYGDDKIHTIYLGYSMVGDFDSAVNRAMIQVRTFAVVPATDGMWSSNKYYKLFQTVIKNNIESLPTSMGNVVTVYDDSQKFKIGRPAASSTSGSITTEGKVYWQVTDEDGNTQGEKYLLCHYDYDKGVMWAGNDDEVWSDWSSNRSSKTFSEPPLSSTYGIETGYPDNTRTINALWKSATTIGKQIYIANVLKQKVENVAQSDSYDGISTDSVGGMTNGVVATESSANFKMFFTASGKIIRWGPTNGAGGGDNAAGQSPVYNNWERLMDLKSGDKFVLIQDTSTDASAASNPNLNKILTCDSAPGTDDTANSGTSHQITVDETITDYVPNSPSSLTIVKFEQSYDASMILKSVIGSEGGFPDSLFLDLEFAGDTINVIESSGDRLLIFSNHQLNMINVAQEIEYIEATFDHMGVSHPRQVCKVGEGVAFVNASGVFFFDGEQINPLVSDKIMIEAWNDTTTAIAYDAMRDLLWVWISNENIYFYSFTNQSWVGKSTKDTSNLYMLPETNTVSGPNGFTHYINSADNAHQVIGTSVDGSGDDMTFNLTTGKISCGDFSRRKRFYTVYITHKGSDGSVTVHFSTTSDSSITTDTSPTTLSASAGGTTTKLDLPSASGKWIVFEFTSTDCSSDWEISDISLIFREKTVK